MLEKFKKAIDDIIKNREYGILNKDDEKNQIEGLLKVAYYMDNSTSLKTDIIKYWRDNK